MKEPLEEYKSVEELELKDIGQEFPKVFRKISCPSCKKEVAASNLNLQNNVAKCGGCNVIFSFEEEVESVRAKKEMKQQVLRPEGIDLFFYKDNLDITIQQHFQGFDAVGLLFMPIFAILSILIFYIGKHPISPYIPIALSLGSLYFIYKGLTYSKNKTYIDISDNFLNIKSRPKNFKKDKSYRVDEVHQLYLKNAGDGSGYFTLFMVVNGLEGQKHEKLFTVNTLSKAKYLEQEIERYLNIEDLEIPESDV